MSDASLKVKAVASLIGNLRSAVKVLDGLRDMGYVLASAEGDWCITPEGLKALIQQVERDA